MPLSLLRRYTPRPLISVYHRGLAFVAALAYGFPSRSLIVIGVTGTKGKSTTSVLIAQLLENLGYHTGYSSTIGFKAGAASWLNDKKMTMPGRFATQRLLRQMVSGGATHAVVETSSEGISQWRHTHIAYDECVFTNLTPEHIEAHGSFENYRAAKEKLFAGLAPQGTAGRRKTFGGKRIPKIIIANADDEESTRILAFYADKKVTFGASSNADLVAKDITLSAAGASFTVNDVAFESNLLGRFNVMNALAAIAAVHALGIPLANIAAALATVKPLPGRQELIDAGQPFSVMVDYAYEPESQRQLYDLIQNVLKPKGTIIHVTGSAGGGRDKSRREILGRLAATHAGIVVITNEDPYDEDPQRIMDMVAAGAFAAGRSAGRDVFLISDRREAIAKALSLAQPHDFVLITGKGSEQALCVANGKKIPWDDRAVVRELLAQKTN